MNTINVILSAINPADLFAPDAMEKPSSPWLSEVLIVLGLVLALFCVALMIVWVFREKKAEIVMETATKQDSSVSSTGLGALLNKHRHRKYKRRFPTLAERGGLPPKKGERDHEPTQQV